MLLKREVIACVQIMESFNFLRIFGFYKNWGDFRCTVGGTYFWVERNFLKRSPAPLPGCPSWCHFDNRFKHTRDDQRSIKSSDAPEQRQHVLGLQEGDALTHTAELKAEHGHHWAAEPHWEGTELVWGGSLVQGHIPAAWHPALLKETGGLGLPWGFGTSVGEASCCPVLRTTRHLHPKYITASQETHGYNALKGVEEIKSRIDVMVNVLQGFACSLVVFHMRTRPRKIQDNMQMHKAALKKTEKEVKSIYKVKRKEAIEKG